MSKTITINELLELVKATLESEKAVDLVSLNLEGKTDIASYMVIASGTSSRHIKSMAEILLEKIEPYFKSGVNVEGLNSSSWILIDAFDIIINIFMPEERAIYNIEKLWK